MMNFSTLQASAEIQARNLLKAYVHAQISARTIQVLQSVAAAVRHRDDRALAGFLRRRGPLYQLPALRRARVGIEKARREIILAKQFGQPPDAVLLRRLGDALLAIAGEVACA